VVLINGPVVTGRDALHHYLLHHDAPRDLRGAILYHCGPVMMKVAPTSRARPERSEGVASAGLKPGATNVTQEFEWRTTAAGPTTSIREEPYEADVIKRYGIRGVMGKGGMGKKTLAALQEFGAVYLHAIGGAAQYYARCLPKVLGVDLLDELGVVTLAALRVKVILAELAHPLEHFLVVVAHQVLILPFEVGGVERVVAKHVTGRLGQIVLGDVIDVLVVPPRQIDLIEAAAFL